MKAYGNLMNRVMENCKPEKPEVGMGATKMMYSDRHAFTIIEVINPKKIVVQADTATRVDKNGMSDSQEYTYEPNKHSPRITLRMNKHGVWKEIGQPDGSTYVIGIRDEYFDYCF